MAAIQLFASWATEPSQQSGWQKIASMRLTLDLITDLLWDALQIIGYHSACGEMVAGAHFLVNEEVVVHFVAKLRR
jgi:hypothetical protein